MHRIHDLLLRLLPEGFREEYGEMMRETLAERAREARARGRLARVRFGVREAFGLARTVLRERAAAGRAAVLARSGSGGTGGPGFFAGFRQFVRHPLYAFASAGTLALAVGAGGASLAVVERAFLEPLPYAEPDGLLALYTEAETWPDSPVSPHVLQDMIDAGAPFAAYAPMDPDGITYTTEEGTRSASTLRVTTDYFSTLGVRPALGGVWAPGVEDAVVVSWRFWQEAMGAVADPIGHPLMLNGTKRIVIGVMAEDFVPPWFTGIDTWTPIDLAAERARLSRGARTLSVVARLAPRASRESADAFLAGFTERMQQAYPDVHVRQRFVAEPLRVAMLGEATPALLGVGAAAVLLLLIVSANLAGLATVRAVGLRTQTAVRVALGASRGRLVRERIVDGLAIASVGTAAGLVLAHTLARLAASAQASFLPRMAAIEFGPRLVLATGLAGLVVAVSSIVLPEGVLVRGGGSIASSRGASGGAGATAVRSTLVVFQVALSVILIVGAGLLVRTVRALAITDLGFDAHDVLIANVDLPASAYADEEAQVAYERRVLERLNGMAEVDGATASIGVVVAGGSRAGFSLVDGEDASETAEVAYFSIAPGYVDFYGMRVIDGRDLSDEERLGGPGAVLVNETLAKRVWPGRSAVGQRVVIGPPSEEDPFQTVVGVVSDIRQHGPVAPVLATVYGSTRQYTWARRIVSVRGPAEAAAGALRVALSEGEPAAAVGRIESIDALVRRATARHRVVLATLGLFGAVATALSAFGLFAVVSLSSRLRRREYAIRIAVGAEHRSVRWMVVRQGLMLGALGTVLGMVGAATGTRVLAGLLRGVGALDPVTFAGAGVAVVALAVLAAWIPARQAGRIDPSETLQPE